MVFPAGRLDKDTEPPSAPSP